MNHTESQYGILRLKSKDARAAIIQKLAQERRRILDQTEAQALNGGK